MNENRICEYCGLSVIPGRQPVGTKKCNWPNSEGCLRRQLATAKAEIECIQHVVDAANACIQWQYQFGVWDGCVYCGNLEDADGNVIHKSSCMGQVLVKAVADYYKEGVTK
jgi:hypothetical protein